jgi:hypothetical protein
VVEWGGCSEHGVYWIVKYGYSTLGSDSQPSFLETTLLVFVEMRILFAYIGNISESNGRVVMVQSNPCNFRYNSKLVNIQTFNFVCCVSFVKQ